MNMKTTKKVLVTLMIVTQISVAIWATSQGTLTKIHKMRTTTLQELKELAHKLAKEIKATEKKIHNSNSKDADRFKKDLHELEHAQSDIEEQIEDFYKWASKTKGLCNEQSLASSQKELKANAQMLAKNIKEKAQETKEAAKDKLQELIPSKETVEINALKLAKNAKEKAHEVKEGIKDNTSKITKGSKNIFNKAVDEVKNGVKEGAYKVKSLFNKIGDTLKYKKSPTTYKINEYQSKDGSKYYLVITMPNFVKEQTDISINEASKGNFVLNIKAKNDEVKKKINDNSEAAPVSEKLKDSTIINNEKYTLYYCDGNLEATIQLPQNINHDTYTVEFENHILKIEFEQEKES